MPASAAERRRKQVHHVEDHSNPGFRAVNLRCTLINHLLREICRTEGRIGEVGLSKSGEWHER
jgi:hypothetical protein